MAACSLVSVASLTLLTDVLAAPTQNPPTGTFDALLDTGSTSQTKTGPLTIQGALTANNVTVTGTTSVPQICLPNGGCRSSWPSPNYSTPNLGTVAANNNYVSSPIWGTNLAINLGGVWRYNWPSPSYNGRSGHAYTISDPWNCYGGATCNQTAICGGEYYMCGTLNNIWGFIDHYACCRIYFQSY